MSGRSSLEVSEERVLTAFAPRLMQMIKMAKPVAWRVNTGEGWTLHHTLDDAKQAAGVTDQGAHEGGRWPEGPIQPLYTIDDAIEEALSMVSLPYSARIRRTRRNKTSYDSNRWKHRKSGIRIPDIFRPPQIQDVARVVRPVFQIAPA